MILRPAPLFRGANADEVIPGITTVEVPKKYFKKYKKAIGKNINYTYIKGK